MKFRINLIVFIVLCALSTPIAAENSKNFYGGMTIASFQYLTQPSGRIEKSSNLDTGGVVGHGVGLQIEYKLAPFWRLTPDILYTNRGTSLEGTIGDKKVKRQDFSTYLHLPVLVDYGGLSEHLRLGAGGYLSMRLSNRGSDLAPLDDRRYRPFDYGLNFQVGGTVEADDILFKTTLRLDYGLADITESSRRVSNVAVGLYTGFLL